MPRGPMRICWPPSPSWGAASSRRINVFRILFARRIERQNRHRSTYLDYKAKGFATRSSGAVLSPIAANQPRTERIPDVVFREQSIIEQHVENISHLAFRRATLNLRGLREHCILCLTFDRHRQCIEHFLRERAVRVRKIFADMLMPNRELRLPVRLQQSLESRVEIRSVAIGSRPSCSAMDGRTSLATNSDSRALTSPTLQTSSRSRRY